MQQPRPQFLTCAGFARNQNRTFDFGGPLNRLGDPAHRDARTEHPVAAARMAGEPRIAAHVDSHGGIKGTTARITNRGVGRGEA